MTVDTDCSARLEATHVAASDLSVINISVAGAGLISSTPLGEVGESVKMMFTLSPAELSFRARCMVRCVIGQGRLHADDTDRWLNGVYFESIAGPSRTALQGFIENRLSQSATDA